MPSPDPAERSVSEIETAVTEALSSHTLTGVLRFSGPFAFLEDDQSYLLVRGSLFQLVGELRAAGYDDGQQVRVVARRLNIGGQAALDLLAIHPA